MSTPSHRFVVTIAADGEMSAIPITFDQRAIFGRARPPVVVAINGYTYRSTVAIMSGETFVPLRRSNRIAAGVEQGRDYEVTLTLDVEPREVPLPEALAAALDAAGARVGWDALSVTTRREHAEGIAAAKRDETRIRRIGIAVRTALSRA